MNKARLLVGLLALTLVGELGVASPVSAGGYEIPITDARGLGRANAIIARANDPMTVLLNPAGLGSLPGHQLLLNASYLFASSCFDREGTYDPSWGTVNGEPIPYGKVCNKKSLRETWIPMFGWTWRLSKKVGMGVGIFPPPSERSQIYGSARRSTVFADGSERTQFGWVPAPDGYQPGGLTITNPEGQALLPSPTRYNLVAREQTVLYPMIGFGVQPVKWFQFGFSIGNGFLSAKFNNAIRSLVPGEDTTLGVEGYSRTKVRDFFAPRIVASLHFIPVDSLDIVFAVRFDEDFEATGTITNELPIIRDNGDPNPAPGEATRNSIVGGVNFRAPRPLWLSFGIRYGHRIRDRAEDHWSSYRKLTHTVDDHFSNEKWDIELNVVYENNSDVDALTVTTQGLLPEQPCQLDQNGDPVNPGDPECLIQNPLRFPLSLPHRWHDQLIVRLGGDWNIFPGVWAVRAGVSYETDGYQPKLGLRDQTAAEASAGVLDFFPLQRWGLHLGTTYRRKRWEFSAGYTHYFLRSRRVEVNDTDPAVRQIVISPAGGGTALDTGPQVNAGTISSSVNIASVTMRVFFR